MPDGRDIDVKQQLVRTNRALLDLKKAALKAETFETLKSAIVAALAEVV